MGMTWLLGTGHHRKNHRRRPAPVPHQDARLVLAEPAAEDMTIDELRRFLDEAEARAGADAGRLRPRVAVRFSGAVKGIWVKLPR